jgi:hypothetical protein
MSKAQNDLITRIYGLVGLGQYDGASSGWWLNQPGSSGVYCYANNVQYWFPILGTPGTVITAISLKWGTNIIGNGIICQIKKRDETATGYTYIDHTTPELLVRDPGDPDRMISSITMTPIALDEVYSWYLNLTSQWSSGGITIFSLNVTTRRRFL